MTTENQEAKGYKDQGAATAPAAMVEVFGFKVPTSRYYLHRGHSWAVPEGEDRVRVGLDDFSQKLLGPADLVKLPEPGKVFYQNHICLALIRKGHKAPFLAPVDGVVEEVNLRVAEKPRLVHDDPYEGGWLFTVRTTNLRRNLENLLYGQDNVAFIDQESHRLLGLMDSKIGVTLPSGGAVIDDVYGHYPSLGWRPLIQEFFLQLMAKDWRKRPTIIPGAEAVPEALKEAEKREIIKVLNRTLEDREFWRALMELQTDALERYKLSPEAKAAILAGDLQWLNEHIGELTQKQLMFVLSCLLPEEGKGKGH
uniref:Glycine cleavage system protein H n=1 Tax=Desulfobacca acetoxidans TaxID=60893 RepID=A0A7V4LCS3_9BACT